MFCFWRSQRIDQDVLLRPCTRIYEDVARHVSGAIWCDARGSTSHGKDEVSNRAVLELRRVGLLLSGLGFEWVDPVIGGIVWKRWPVGTELTFKPTAALDTKDNFGALVEIVLC